MTIKERLEDTETALHIAQVDGGKWKARAIKLAEILGIRDCDIDDFDLSNATNGDVIKAMFPNISIYEHGSTYSVNNEYNFNSTWWNKPYKAEREVRNEDDRRN